MKFKIALFILLAFIIKMKTHANVIGTDAQNFNPITNGIDFVTVHSSKTLKPGILNMGLFFNYAVNTFPVFRTDTGSGVQSTNSINDSLTSGDFNFGLGLAKDWDFGVSFPVIYNQTVENPLNLGRFENSGITEIRVNSKYRLTGDDTWGLAAVLTVNFNRIENNPYVGVDSGPIINFELAASTEFNHINLALNIGHRWRSPGPAIPGIGIEPIPNQFIYSAAASYHFSHIDTKLILEFLSAQPSSESVNSTDRELSTYEALIGVKYDVNTNLALHLGGGAELAHGTATPDYRVYAGLNYALGPLFARPAFRVIKTRRVKRRQQAPKTISLTGLKFDFNSANISDESEVELEELIYTLAADIRVIKRIEVEGFTDSVGKSEYNQELSQKRADAVRVFLIKSLQIAEDKVIATGFGEEFPIADNSNYQGRSTNRRVNLKVFK